MELKNTSVANFFKEAFGIKWEDMEINKIIDVQDYNKYVEAYDEKGNTNKFYQVTKIIRKSNAKKYMVIGKGNTFNCSGEHKIAMKLHKDKKDFTYMSVSTLANKKFLSYDKNEQWVDTTVKKTNEEIPILDFEVDTVHNYYSNDILSHNTMFGSPETTSGGQALKFYSSVRLEVRKAEFLTKGDEPYGLKSRVKSVKNKTAPPFRKVEMNLLFDKGYEIEQEYLTFAVMYDIVDKAGSWYSYKDNRLGQGLDNACNYLKEDPSMFNEIKKRVLDMLNPKKEITAKDYQVKDVTPPNENENKEVEEVKEDKETIKEEAPKKRGRPPKKEEE